MAKEICAKLPSLREGCSNRSDMLHAKDCRIAGASLSPLSKFSCSDRSRFGHLQPDRKAAIRSDSRDCQSFHTESLQSYAELCRARWSRFVSCQGQTEQGCRGTVVHGHGLQWASGQAVKRWLCASCGSCGSCGSCIFVLHILLWQTINATRAANRNFLKYKKFGYQPYHILPRFFRDTRVPFFTLRRTIWKPESPHRHQAIFVQGLSVTRDIQMTWDSWDQFWKLVFLNGHLEHFGTIAFCWQMIFMKSNSATIKYCYFVEPASMCFETIIFFRGPLLGHVPKISARGTSLFFRAFKFFCKRGIHSNISQREFYFTGPPSFQNGIQVHL